MNQSEDNSRIILSLQSIRALGAILIFLHHSGLKGSVITSFGDFAVCCFFMLSGFVLSLKYKIFTPVFHSSSNIKITNRKIYSFAISRLKKIAPLYYLTLVAMLVFAKFDVPFVSVLCSLLMVQSWIPDDSVFFSLNGPEWFISDIMFCYLAFWPIVACIQTYRDHLKLIATVLLTVYFIVINTISAPLTLFWIYIFPPMQLPTFIIGMFIHYAAISLKEMTASFQKQATYCVAASFSIIIIFMAYYKYIPDRFSLSSYWWAPTALLIGVLAITDRTKSFATRILHNRFIILLGNASMTFYFLTSSLFEA